MFPRIVSQLSLSPQALSLLAFYGRRLRQEKVTRTFSAIAACLIVGLQFLTIAAPPSPTNASSTNDIYSGGFVSRVDLLNRYDENAELRNLYTGYFGISRADIANAQVAYINSTDHNLKSVGRIQHSSSDTEIHTSDNLYYGRPLYVWDTGANVQNGSTYEVLQGITAKGNYWAIMFACGNPVYKTLPVKATPTPVPKAAVTVPTTPAPTSGCLDPGKPSSYVTSFTRGTGTVSTKNNLPLCQAGSLELESFSMPDTWDGQGFNASALPQARFDSMGITLPAGAPNLHETLTVKVPEACQNTQIDFYFPPVYSKLTGLHDDDARYINGMIFARHGSCQATPTPTPKPAPTPKASSIVCSKLSADTTTGPAPLTVKFTSAATATGQTVSEYQYSFGDEHSIISPSAAASHTYVLPGQYTATLSVTSSTGAVSAAVATCTVNLNVLAPPASYVKAKSAQNLSQNRDATTAPAQAGDQIRYSLTTKNAGGIAGDYTVVEHIDDILEYADVTDTGGATLAKGVLTWPAVSIDPGATLLKTFSVKIKSPVPSTPLGVSDRFSYDLRLDNIYGNQVSITVAPPPAKQIEGASTSLPDTGAATSTLIILAVAFLAVYFYFRNRQLMTEIHILRGSYQGGL
ncbi:MAG TPA: PKD domain-containing protein [Candidatus Saccharimonadia bacterium]